MKTISNLFLIIVILSPSLLSAQIERQFVDQKNHNVTVVIKDENSSDQAILEQLNWSGIGMGEEVQISTEMYTASTASDLTNEFTPKGVDVSTYNKSSIEAPTYSSAPQIVETPTTTTLVPNIPAPNKVKTVKTSSKIVPQQEYQNMKKVSKLSTNTGLGWQPSEAYVLKKEQQLAAKKRATQAAKESKIHSPIYGLPAPPTYNNSTPSTITRTSNSTNIKTRKKRNTSSLFKVKMKKRKKVRGKKWQCFKF